MLRELYDERKLMPVWEDTSIDWKERRAQIVELLQKEEYGFMPRMHDSLEWEEVSVVDDFCAGKVPLRKVMLTATFGEDKFSFPIYVMIPKAEGKYPFFVHVAFRENIPDMYMPVEEICDRGFAVISFCYQDVTRDDNEPLCENYGEGLNDILYKGYERTPNSANKIAMWAWACSRAMDYAQTIDCLDKSNAAVIGHSRLGKTALLAAAQDERFTCAISNNSGCSGAAISRDKKGERIDQIIRFKHWFCTNYWKYAFKEDDQPFDQHFLLAAIAPRKLYVSSASDDEWADPESEYLGCYAASEVYEKLGMKGFVSPDRLPVIGDCFQEGDIGYHLRAGAHYLGREDWNKFMDFMQK